MGAEAHCFGVVYVKQVIERQQVLSAYVETYMVYLPLAQQCFRQRISQCNGLQAQISGILKVAGLRFAVTGHVVISRAGEVSIAVIFRP